MSDDKCNKAFKDWYWHHGAEWNATSVKPVFEAGFKLGAKSEWQPIETAPKDGTYILLFIEDSVISARWRIADWDVAVLSSHGCGCCASGNSAPTHWMPLPEPPK
jgi:hypothetical protein